MQNTNPKHSFWFTLLKKNVLEIEREFFKNSSSLRDLGFLASLFGSRLD